MAKRFTKSMQGRKDRWHRFSFNPMMTTVVLESKGGLGKPFRLTGSAHLQVPMSEAPKFGKKLPCSPNNRRYKDALLLTAARRQEHPNHETRQQRRWLEREYNKQ